MEQAWKALMLAGWSPRKAVELAVAIEEKGEETYRSLTLRWEGDAGLRDTFRRLSNEEAAHQAGFRSMIARASPAAEGAAGIGVEQLRTIADGFFNDQGGWALSGLENASDPAAVLERVLAFERATLNFYKGLRDLLGKDAALEQMISEEKRHTEEVGRAIARARASSLARV